MVNANRAHSLPYLVALECIDGVEARLIGR